MIACPDLGVSDASIAAVMDTIDCHIGTAVAASYGRLFGSSTGALSQLLTGALTLYIALIGFRMMTGRGGTLSALSPKVVTLAVVLTFATAWPAYQTVVVGLLSRGPDELVRVLTGGDDARVPGFADRIDDALTVIADAAAMPRPKGEAPTSPASLNAGLLWASALLLLVSTVGVLIASKIVLGVLLSVGPAFVVLALFRATTGLFEGWLKTAVLFAVAPLLATLIGSGALMLLEPAIEALAEPVAADAVRPSNAAVMVFLGALIYAFMTILAWTASAGLVRGWRLFPDRRDAQPSAASVSPSVTISSGASQPAQTLDISVGRAPVYGPANSAGPPSATTTLVQTVGAASPPVTTVGPGLGQSFRLSTITAATKATAR